MKVLVTGVAGFVGFHTALALLSRGDIVIGVDNLNDYYDVSLKEARLKEIIAHPNANNFKFVKLDLAVRHTTEQFFSDEKPEAVLHLAAQAGVRYSLENPYAYISSNIVAFTHILEACRTIKPKHLVYASSSSVYGGNTKIPFSESDSVDHPVSLYAATKKANELMAHTYSHLYGIPTTGLRFFTVYGPWGRPDMSPFLFADAIINHKPIQVFNYGDMMRDFTYIDDIVESVIRVLDKPACAYKNQHLGILNPPYKVFNIGNSNPVKLLDFIKSLEESIGQTAEKVYMPMQDGDVKATYADTSELENWVGFKPHTPLEQGINNFVIWYKKYYSIS